MPDNNSILEKLEGLESRYEEISTLITDPSVIADQERYVRLTREYKDLDDIMKARKNTLRASTPSKKRKTYLQTRATPTLRKWRAKSCRSTRNCSPRLKRK